MSGRESAAAQTRLTWRQVFARRLARHGLVTAVPLPRMVGQVGVICGVHAQVASAAELSIGVRVHDAVAGEVRAALWKDRTLVKTWGPRGTIHLLPTHELALWTGAFSAIPSQRTSLPSDLKLSTEQVDAIVAAVADALADAELTVDELTEAIVARAGPWAGDLVMPAFQGMWPRWRLAMQAAGHRGALCFAAGRGRQVTYTSPHRWAGGFTPADGPQALSWLVGRYLSAYGPATPQHFARWLSASPAWSQELFTSLADEIEPVEVEGTTAWVVAGDTDFPADAVTGVRLLPYFDVYAVNSHPRELVFPGRAYERALARGQAGNYPVLVLDGTVAGVWHLRRSGRRLAITVEPFVSLSAAQRRDLDEQVERISAFLDGWPELTIGTVAVGSHA